MNLVKRVLVVSNMYPTAEHPTSGIFVHEQVKALRRAGLDVRVVSGQPVYLASRRPIDALRRFRRMTRGSWRSWDTHDGVPVTRFSYPAGAFARVWTYPWFYAGALRRWLPALAEDFPYDIVHVHTAFLDGRAGISAARHRGVPIVLTEHTGPLSLVTRDWRMRLHTQAGVGKADRLIAVSHALRNDMLAQLHVKDPQRLVVLANGVDTTFFDPAKVTPPQVIQLSDVKRILIRVATRLETEHPGALTGVAAASMVRGALDDARLSSQGELMLSGASRDVWTDPDAIRVLWVGHHVEVKRVDRLLDAFAIAQRHEKRLVLTLLGSGHLELVLRQQARILGIGDHVRFVPATARDGVRDHMAWADFLVLPSQSETFGVVIIEALAMGIPVLATDCGGPRDILDDPTLGMLSGNTQEEVALGLQRMARCIRSFDRTHIRAAAVARFDYARLAESLATAYQEITAGNG